MAEEEHHEAFDIKLPKNKLQYDFLISIDPAGIGSSGTVIINLKTWTIIFKDTYKAKTVTEAKNYFLNLFSNLKLNTKIKPLIFVWVEDFYLHKKITNPLVTAKLIGCLQVITEDIFHWPFATYQPSKKKIIKENYQGNLKLTCHEKDAYKGAKIFQLEHMNANKSFKNYRHS